MDQAGEPSDNVFVTDLPADFQEGNIAPIFSSYGTVISSRYLPGDGVKKNAALIRFASVEEAQWIVDNINGNIPQGLAEPVTVRFASKKGKGGGWKGDGKGDKSNRWEPYNGGSTDNGGKAEGKGTGKKGKNGEPECSIHTLLQGLLQAGALPGGQWSNEENALFIGGLPSDTTTDDMYAIFSPFGAIPARGIKAMREKDGRCSGIGFVNYVEASSMQQAMLTLDGTQMPDGKVLKVKHKGPSLKGSAGKGKK